MVDKEPKSRKLIVELDEERDKKFRDAIVKTKGLHKGVIKEALEEAIDEWIKLQRGKEKLR